MLDERDLKTLNDLSEDALKVKGFFGVVGCVEQFQSAMRELQEHFHNKKGIQGEFINLQSITENEINNLLDVSAPVLYCSGFVVESVIWDRIKIKRDELISRGVIVIFFLNPSQYRQMSDHYSSIFSMLKIYPIGVQHTLDEMGDEFRNRLYEVLERINKCEKMLDELIRKPGQDSPSNFLMILKRWNSFSPILGHRPALSEYEVEENLWSQIRREIRGGGYFLRWQKFGIAIDPGHNFIENLYRAKHSIDEIDAIIITHDHLDHTSDLEAIIDLLYQYQKRGRSKKISLYLNPTTYLKYKDSLGLNDYIERIIRLNPTPGKSHIISKDKGIRLNSILAQHTELGKVEKAVSLRFHLTTSKKGKNISIGFTSDTGWHENLKNFFQDVDILVPHIGSIKRSELEEAKFYRSHLGILGLFKILQDINAANGVPVVIISEFGEELKGLRDILGEELGQKFPRMKIFPGDIGHLVELEPGNIRILCGKNNCKGSAASFFEHNGEIQLRCLEHKPAMGIIDKYHNASSLKS